MPEIKKVTRNVMGGFSTKKTVPIFPINPSETIKKDNLNIVTPMVKPIGVIEEMLQNKDKINFSPPSLPIEKKDNVMVSSHPLAKNYHYLVDSDSPISAKYNQPKQNNIANVFDDVGTQLLNSVQTFGGSIIGDAINMVSPSAADIVEKYTAGVIPHTSQQQFESNRGDNEYAWSNRISNTANAASTAIVGELFGAGMNWGANKIASGELKNKIIERFPIFIKSENSLSRGIGKGRVGLDDLSESGRNLIKPISKVVGKGDDVVKLVERKQVFDKETLDLINKFNKYYAGDKSVKLSLLEKTKIGRDVAARKDLNKAYRNTHIDEIIEVKKQGYFNNNKFPDTDWYYGGSSSKYGNIEIEAVPDSKFFRLFEVDGKYVGIVTPDKEILHLKGTNVPYKGTIIRYKRKELSDDMLERISKIYKKGDNLDEIISSITK